MNIALVSLLLTLRRHLPTRKEHHKNIQLQSKEQNAKGIAG